MIRSWIGPALLLAAFAAPSGAGAEASAAVQDAGGSRGAGNADESRGDSVRVLRPVPAPVVQPPRFRAALEAGTRAPDGRPGPAYWTQWATYDIEARLDPATGVLVGSERILYENRSPDTLATLHLNLYQNLHREGVARNEPQEVTGGVELGALRVDGMELADIAAPGAPPYRGGPGYQVSGTQLALRPARPVPPGASLELELEWTVSLPQSGAGRMGWSDREVYFVAYWFPKMAVYDDLGGWDQEPYLGNAEFHDGFGDYRVSLTLPEGWTAMATGDLVNAERVLGPRTLERLEAAARADTMVAVIGEGDRDGGGVSAAGTPAGELTWEFRADSVRDFAWTASSVQRWTATSALIPDRDGDGTEDRVLIHSFWRPDRAPLWEEQALYGKHAIEFHSRYTGLPYPWGHMTSVEGADIIGGGMEFPMLTVMGTYQGQGAQALYSVTSHELAHMWIPMIVGTNERRHAWMDEGATTFLENQSRPDFSPGDPADEMERESYLSMARAEVELPLMRHGDFYGPGPAYAVASYWKPATLLVTLRGLLGEEAFLAAYRSFVEDWAYRHPTPWDFFNAFEREAGRDLDWLWTSWYYETWTLDHAVASVEAADGADAVDGRSDAGGAAGQPRTVVTVEDRGWAVMPARVRVTTTDGRTLERTVPVDPWLRGRTRATVEFPVAVDRVERVEIDPERHFPDVDRDNDVWETP